MIGSRNRLRQVEILLVRTWLLLRCYTVSYVVQYLTYDKEAGISGPYPRNRQPEKAAQELFSI